MPQGLDLFMQVQDDLRNMAGVKAFLGSNFFVASMGLNPVMGQSDIVVVEGAGLHQSYPTIGEVGNPLILNAPAAFRYGPVAGYVLPTTRYTAVKDTLHALVGLTLPSGGGPTIAISAQLSGCSICYRPSGNGLTDAKVIHIQPDGLANTPPIGRKDSVKLQNILELRNACFAGDLARPTRVYGGKDTGDQRANIIFLRRDGRWTLFAQRYPTGSSNVSGVDMVPLYT
ncbi:hypothetical protein [Ferrovibrio terrae]|uniref:hypothetical protein n=1 Tax=Ferrovibrio terrae TaxID=2594003 RepID=UPI0031376EEE